MPGAPLLGLEDDGEPGGRSPVEPSKLLHPLCLGLGFAEPLEEVAEPFSPGERNPHREVASERPQGLLERGIAAAVKRSADHQILAAAKPPKEDLPGSEEEGREWDASGSGDLLEPARRHYV